MQSTTEITIPFLILSLLALSLMGVSLISFLTSPTFKSLFVNSKAAKKENKSTPSGAFDTEELKGSGNGSFPKYTQRKYFIALCLMYPNLGGTLQEIQAVGLGQQPELSDNCKGYIQGFMQALIDARAWHFDSLVQMDAFVQQLLTDTDILKSFVKDFKNDIEETIELTLNPSVEHL